MINMTQNKHLEQNNASQIILNEGEEECFCEKKQCMIGLASIAIGVGGFVLASLL